MNEPFSAMQNQIVPAWQQLMQQLVDVPATLAEAEGQLSTQKMDLASERRTLETIGDVILDEAIAQAGGIKAFGANEEERKKRSRQVLSAHVQYRNQERFVMQAETAVMRQQNLVDDLTRQYGAVGYQARLVAAMLQYLGQAGAPINHGAISLSLPEVSNGFNGSAMSDADAESLGF